MLKINRHEAESGASGRDANREIPAPSQEMLNAARAGYRNLSSEASEKLRAFILSRIDASGGFKGMDESPDIYYSVFGIECMLAAGMDISVAGIDKLLPGNNTTTAGSILNISSLIRLRCRTGYSDKGETAALAGQAEEFRRDDGGYADSRDCRNGSVYASFLAALAYWDINAEVPRADSLVDFVLGRQAPGGGMVNRCSEAEPCCTATAAGIVILNRLGVLTAVNADWLQLLEARNGGFYFSLKSKTPDLISTAVSVYALSLVSDGPGRNMRHAEFVQLFWHPEGGFCGIQAGERPDCEHTFYALMALGRLING
ncbi:MAG: prenyltransferase/squalene oxidase repeat-containing protein [Verrucomicrobiota bacterium]